MAKGFGRVLAASFPLAALVAAAAVAPVRAQETGDDALRAAAIADARAGQYEGAIETLGRLHETYPQDLALAHDYLTVLAWSEDDSRAVALAETLDADEAPLFAQLAAAKSARNLRRFDLAGIWYDAALRNEPASVDALAGRLMTAADAADATRVDELSDLIASSELSDPALDLARAYSLRATGQNLQALSAYNSILETSPDDRDALRGKALVLRAMLLPTQALELAAAHPGVLEPAEIERLRVDEAAIRVRLTARTPYPAETAYEGEDRALSLIDSELEATTTDSGRAALLLDRIVALSETKQPAAAIAQFESLPPGANLDQAYVLIAAGNAYLDARRPDDALPLLERAVALEPGNIQARFGLIYALLDLERFDEAYALARELTDELPMVNQVAGSPVTKGNEQRIQAELLAGIAEAYGDQLEAAQQRFETLLERAPNNGSLRHELANVYRWRGWLDRSVDQYRQVVTNNEDLLSAELGLAHALMDANDFAGAERRLTDVSADFAREPSVQRLADRWEVHNKRELIVTASTGDSTGPVSGSDNYTVDARWYTAPIAYRYRAFVASHDGYAEFPEGESRRRRLGGGVEYRSRRFTVTGMISGSRRGGGAGIAGETGYRLSDYWSLGGGLEWNSDAVQLRAHRLDIEADRIFANATFAPNELASVVFGIDRMAYSDGNNLHSLYANGRFRVINRPRSKVDVTGYASTGRADTSNVPYYSPTRNGSIEAGVIHSYRLFRRYDRELVQEIGLGTGQYYQAGFGSNPTWSVTYRIDWRLSDRLAVGAGAERYGQYFDGAREHSTIVNLSLMARF